MKNIVVCLMPGAQFDKSTAGLLASARGLKGQLTVIVTGTAEDDTTASLANQADAVIVAEAVGLNEYQPELVLGVLQTVCSDLNPDIVLMAGDTYSQELTPRLAGRLGGVSAGDAQSLTLENDNLRITRSVYGGKAMAVVELRSTPAVVWVRARSFAPAAPRDSSGSIEKRTVELSGDAAKHVDATKIVERHEESSGTVRLEDAMVIVAGGRGLGGSEPFEELKSLAETMNAQQAASRAACDAGWVPPHWQVGQTGKKVAPELYVAIAISGASQHLMGIADAKVVTAINTDSDAPIFKHCQFGLVEDYKAVVGPLTERLKALLS